MKSRLFLLIFRQNYLYIDRTGEAVKKGDTLLIFDTESIRAHSLLWNRDRGKRCFYEGPGKN